jgi:hypothetical protein
VAAAITTAAERQRRRHWKADLARDPEYLGLVECTLAVVRI